MKRVFIVLFFYVNNTIIAQNLIPNSGFEEADSCLEFKMPCTPNAWKLTSPFLPLHHSNESESIAYVSIIMFSKTEPINREYLQVPILCPLVKGQNYSFRLSFKVKKECSMKLGVLFSDRIIFNSKNIVLDVNPSLEFNVRKQKKWATEQIDFIAKGDEKYLIIGNFEKEALRAKAITRIYIDNVGLFPKDSTNTCDYSYYKSLIYGDTRRHSLNRQNLFPEYPYDSKDETDKNSIIKLEIDRDSSLIFRLENIHFELNKSELLNVTNGALDSLASFLLIEEESKIEIYGHTDNSGNEEHNLLLSEARAKSVAFYLMNKGVESARINFKGYGSSKPLFSIDNEEENAKNRRVEFKITNPK